ncbi:actin cytoskeleton-regulatory complex protein PAN1 isoform X2 [Sorghum bicolor]|uniref:actin cytoskeleton-regulatory complex protein PAN1 isoform X2 n=1 Tax=Sorghum bicolor TaxID=4558 RepID=UPI000B426043|nr:actin cytoskeleton-regulatory complex protein PAN1 isoform X2 [Sorghum bicolor]|eukprot:XP_021317321.1 actin cytoskeleton-regulatory complex protein PAN1 isoform X2 [Sorghum bicolor]
MSRRSKREMASPPQISSPSVPMMPAARPREMAPPPQISSPSASDFLSGPGCFPTPPASINTTMGSAAPSPWWCGPPVPQQGMSWWPAPSCGGGATASSSQSVQKDDIDSDPKEWFLLGVLPEC